MALAQGKIITETTTNFKNYIGLGIFNVLTVNPTKKELEDMGRTVEQEPSYLMTLNDEECVRVEFTIKAADEFNNFTTRHSFILTKKPMTNKEETKCKVIDEFGRTAWVTKEELSKHSIPQYSNGPARISANYRPLYRGEEELTNFIKRFVYIEDLEVFRNGEYIQNPKIKTPQEAECRLDHIADYFKGDFSELKAITEGREMQRVILLLGIRRKDDKTYQTTYNKYAMWFNDYWYQALHKVDNNTAPFKKLEDELNALQTTTSEYELCYLREYVEPTPTNFTTEATPTVEEQPFNFDNNLPF